MTCPTDNVFHTYQGKAICSHSPEPSQSHRDHGDTARLSIRLWDPVAVGRRGRDPGQSLQKQSSPPCQGLLECALCLALDVQPGQCPLPLLLPWGLLVLSWTSPSWTDANRSPSWEGARTGVGPAARSNCLSNERHLQSPRDRCVSETPRDPAASEAAQEKGVGSEDRHLVDEHICTQCCKWGA